MILANAHITPVRLCSALYLIAKQHFLYLVSWDNKSIVFKTSAHCWPVPVQEIYRLRNRKTKNLQMKVFPEVFVMCMAVREASVVFYVLFVSEWEGGIRTESRQRGTSSAASVKRAFDNTGTLSTSYTDYTEPLDTETHVSSLKDTQSCRYGPTSSPETLVMRLSASQWACPHVGVSPQFWVLSLSMFVLTIPKSDLCHVLQSATKISSLLIMSLCSLAPLECWFSICAYLSNISLGGTTSHHTLLMRQDEYKDMFNVRSSSPAEINCLPNHALSHTWCRIYSFSYISWQPFCAYSENVALSINMRNQFLPTNAV